MPDHDADVTWQHSTGTVANERNTSADSREGRRFGRFSLTALIGEGGMGRVYEAFDVRLQRTVALKVMRNDDPVSVRRFVREARSQAQVAHPGICPIYETGEADGKPFIVMQRLHGCPLDEAAIGLAIEQRVILIRQVAEAVHAAHRTGLIHRDLKPANILVEPSSEGVSRPYVLDFGLARPTVSPGLTRTGDLIGTPAYMAPEQVWGKSDLLDRRIDIYALGATLYRLLAGKAPFDGVGDAATTLRRMLVDEPSPLGSFGIPADLEAVVFKCLEKERNRRYGSACELVEDLDRYLNGEPVSARPAGKWYRLRKWLRRHRAMVSVTGLASLLLVIALGWGVWTMWRASERERLIQTFTEEVEEVEAMVRYSQLVSLHDIRSDRRLLRQRMEIIRKMIDDAGRLGRGPGLYALGRGHLALDELEAAREHLSAAWEDGYQTYAVAATLGQTLSAIYRQRLASVELVRDWETRQKQHDALVRRYGEPARFFLAQVPENGVTPFLEILRLFHADQFEEALMVLEESPARRAWDYELDQLEGDVRRTWAMALDAAGALDAAREQLRLAQVAYERAVAIAPSTPALYRASAQTAFHVASLDGSTGRDLELLLSTGIEAAGRGLAADPEDGRGWLWKARLHRAVARELHNSSNDPTVQMSQAVDAGARAAELLREPSAAWRELGRAHSGWARWLDERGKESADRLRDAIAALDRVASSDRDYEYWIFLGQARRHHADRMAAQGEPAVEAYILAIEAYRAAAALHSEPLAAWVNLGSSYLAAAALPEEEDPLALLRQAGEVLRRAQALRSDHVAPPYYLGRVALQLARGGRTDTDIAEPELAQQSILHYRRAIELAPAMFQAHSGLGQVFNMLALHAWDVGEEPNSWLRQAKASYRRAAELAPESDVPWLNLAWAEYYEAKFLLRGSGDIGTFLDAAQRNAQRARDFSGEPFALLCLASIHRIRAEHALLSRGDPTRSIAAAEELLSQALTENPKLAEVHRSFGRLYSLEIEWLASLGQPIEGAIERARHSLDRALELAPSLASFWLADARWALSIPPQHRTRDHLDRGLAGAQRALELRAAWPEALAARGAILNALGDGIRGEEDLTNALAANPYLVFEWRPATTDR